MSKTRKRVLSVLAILFAIALVFTACLALTGCGDSDDDDTKKNETTTTGTGTLITASDLNSEYFPDGSWIYQYEVTSYTAGNTFDASSDGTSTVYLWIFEKGELLFGNESYYESFTGSYHQSMGLNGTWTYESGTFSAEASSSSNTVTVTENEDGTVTITGTSGMSGTYVATIDPSNFAA